MVCAQTSISLVTSFRLSSKLALLLADDPVDEDNTVPVGLKKLTHKEQKKLKKAELHQKGGQR